MNPNSIVTAFELYGLSPDEIAEDQEMEVGAVKMALIQHSSAYRDAVKAQEQPDVSDDEYKQILESYKSLALFSENDYVREKALRRLIDEKKGRLNDKSSVKTLKVNVVMINQQLRRTREAREKALSQTPRPRPVIDVSAKAA